MVTLNVGPAGSADLQEGEFSLVGRALFQHALDRQKPLQDAFGIVHTIDANAHKHGFNPELSKQGPAIQISGTRFGLRSRRFWKLHTNGKRLDHSSLPLAVDGKVIPVDAALEGTIHGLQEISAMRLDVKTNHISAQQAVEQFALPWTDGKAF